MVTSCHRWAAGLRSGMHKCRSREKLEALDPGPTRGARVGPNPRGDSSRRSLPNEDSYCTADRHGIAMHPADRTVLICPSTLSRTITFPEAVAIGRNLRPQSHDVMHPHLHLFSMFLIAHRQPCGAIPPPPGAQKRSNETHLMVHNDEPLKPLMHSEITRRRYPYGVLYEAVVSSRTVELHHRAIRNTLRRRAIAHAYVFPSVHYMSPPLGREGSRGLDEDQPGLGALMRSSSDSRATGGWKMARGR